MTAAAYLKTNQIIFQNNWRWNLYNHFWMVNRLKIGQKFPPKHPLGARSTTITYTRPHQSIIDRTLLKTSNLALSSSFTAQPASSLSRFGEGGEVMSRYRENAAHKEHKGSRLSDIQFLKFPKCKTLTRKEKIMLWLFFFMTLLRSSLKTYR